MDKVDIKSIQQVVQSALNESQPRRIELFKAEGKGVNEMELIGKVFNALSIPSHLNEEWNITCDYKNMNVCLVPYADTIKRERFVHAKYEHVTRD